MEYLIKLVTESPVLAAIVAGIVILQFSVALKTRKSISKLNAFFEDLPHLKILKVKVTSADLKNDMVVSRIASTPEDFAEIKEEYDEFGNTLPVPEHVEASLLKIESGVDNGFLSSVVYKTNRYLCKNIGASADLLLLKDICERQVDVLEGEIQNSLNAPLYLGLIGTFLGIISGVGSIDLTHIISNSGVLNMSEFQALLGGVVLAMSASFIGLGLTVLNSTIRYKKASSKMETEKDEYFDFLQRELMPTLSTSLSSSMNALKSVLGHFVNDFGGNLDVYTSSIQTLNDNIRLQHQMLEQLNQLNLTETASKMAETFLSLRDVADSLQVFRSYQQDLNDTMRTVQSAVEDIHEVIDRFNDFGRSLQVVADNQTSCIALQTEFKNAIENHFPTGSVGREIWQKSFDELVTGAKQVTEQLNDQLTASTQYVQNFVNGNKDFFTTFAQMQTVLSQLTQYTQVQAQCYNDLKGEIASLRGDSKDQQKETAELHKSLLEAVKAMTTVVKSINKQ